jgi:chemotaxis protein histidine kinase CheA/ActR/RegA family two-component response regulator
MAIDREKYIKKYVDEGFELISLVETLIFDIKDGISVEDDLQGLLRALHTLKGSSRMLDFKHIEELSHSVESVFVAYKEQRIGLSENAVKLVLSAIDMIISGFKAIQETKNDGIDIQELIKNLALLASNEEFSLIKNDDVKFQSVINNTGNEGYRLETYKIKELTESGKREIKKEPKSDSIRLSIDKINGIIKNIASLQSLEISAKGISRDAALLNKIIKELFETFAEQKKRDNVFALNSRRIERLCERLNSSLKNYAIDTGNSVKNAYDSVISLRTLPLSTIFDSYPRYVYEISSELGKKVQFNIEGKENEIDKNIIESLSEVIMHMVRNAIDHGIETPEERKTAGKNETGKLLIICSRESGGMKIVISDDGSGINHEKIRQKAVKEGFVTEAAAASLSKEELTNFIFQSGFSTSGKLSNISGRGVGMDVVRDSIEGMKGSIVVDSLIGKGTAFTITVPLSIASLMGFPVECGAMKFLIPANFVETILLVNRDEIINILDRPEIKYNDRIIKLFYLDHILNIKSEATGFNEVIFVVIVRSYEDIAALSVDNISSMRSVILKTMPLFFDRIQLFSGIVLNEDYEMVSVLHIPTIVKMTKRIKTFEIKKRNIESEKIRKSILVVDDSKPTRDIEREIFMSGGYMVDTAADGAQALKAVKMKHYDLICTDLRMPVMDGYMFIENLKRNKDLSGIPVIVISSVSNEEEQKRALELGASRYIVKSSFNNNNLLEAVNELTGAGIE